MENFIKEYLVKIGMKGNYTSTYIKCEICSTEENTIIQEQVSLGNNEYTKLPVVSCNNCGYLFQNPRFNEDFYDDFYSTKYRNLLFKKKTPSQSFVDDQISRGQNLFHFLEKYLVKQGNLLDVGSSVGGMMIPFIKNGWQGLGTDPDKGYVDFGKDEMKLPVVDVKAEKMKLENDYFDLIIIMGSLEHVYDPNKTLSICKKSS
jgi:2-polyprenyl-3-methyl-5-hydroxy-6-metoxy-1,4-benzoquinol methylase